MILDEDLNIPVVHKKSTLEEIVLEDTKLDLKVTGLAMLIFVIFATFYVFKFKIFVVPVLCVIYLAMGINAIVLRKKYLERFDKLIVTQDNFTLYIKGDKYEIPWDYVTLEWTDKKRVHQTELTKYKENIKISIPLNNRLMYYIINPWEDIFITFLYYVKLNKHKICGVCEYHG